ncbi:hypothetical protein RRG08_039182 [Elysia crispata]|uniref:Uncharacterized protein n=1 Tax=Elysia crispata TaxID=231223 RepID=A0AAE0ZEM7_9GAST|nr:hypothetical protein RRG08_039182 [Elysia crispata]
MSSFFSTRRDRMIQSKVWTDTKSPLCPQPGVRRGVFSSELDHAWVTLTQYFVRCAGQASGWETWWSLTASVHTAAPC